MPLPVTKNVGTIMHKLNEEGGRPRKQKIAIALIQARKAGAKIPRNPNQERSEAVKKATA